MCACKSPRQEYETTFWQRHKDLNARAMWFRFSAMLVAHGIVLGAFIHTLAAAVSGPDTHQLLHPQLLLGLLVFGQALALIWYAFMLRSHDADLRIDQKLRCATLSLSIDITSVQPASGVRAHVPMYGTVLLFSLAYACLFAIAAVNIWPSYIPWACLGAYPPLQIIVSWLILGLPNVNQGP